MADGAGFSSLQVTQEHRGRTVVWVGSLLDEADLQRVVLF